MKTPKDLKKGRMYYILYKDTSGIESLLISFKGFKRKRPEFRLLAAVCNRSYLPIRGNETTYPDWDTIQECRRVEISDLPLYIYMNNKSPQFVKLLEGQ